MTRILLVNPHETEQDGFSNPPLGLLYIAGTLLQHGFDVRVIDGCLEGLPGIRKSIVEFQPEYIGITCLTPGRKKALTVARVAKEIIPHITVVLGGPHPTIMWKQMLEHYPDIDYIVIGEGEITFLELVQSQTDPSLIPGLVFRRHGQIVKTPPRKYAEDLDQLPFPAWHLIDLHRYPARGEGYFRGIDLAREPRISVIFSRGCTGHCDFCSTWWIWKGWRHRSAVNMVDELQLLKERHGMRHFCFADDAMTVDRTSIIALCHELIVRKLNIAFRLTTRTDCVDKEMLHLLSKAGCYRISFGIETGSPELLKKMSKENDIATSEQAIALCKDAGIKVTALMIIGNVGESEHTIRETVAFLRRTKPDELACVGGLWVLPGTKLYQQCRRKGLIDDDYWLGDSPYMLYLNEFTPEQIEVMKLKVFGYRRIHQKILLRLRRMIQKIRLAAP